MFLSAEKIAAMAGEHRVHFVNPAAKRINKSLGDAAGLKNLGIHMMTVAPGDRSSEYRSHRYEDEAIYVISGRGTAVIGEESFNIGPAISSVSPVAARPTRHSTTAMNRWSASSIGLRLAQDVVDYPRAGKRLYRNSGQRDMVDYPNITKR